jgi:hypothetical protein
MPQSWILGNKFNTTYAHHESLKALWETKWKLPCKLSVYPFHDGKLEDFEPIFDKLIADGVNDAYEDRYTEYFLPAAEKLVQQADGLQSSEERSKLYLRAACLLRIARFPSLDASGPTGIKRKTWDRQKEIYLQAAGLWDEPLKEVMIQHMHAAEGDGTEIPLYMRLPKTVGGGSGGKKVPVVLLLTGLDGHRPDNTGVSGYARPCLLTPLSLLPSISRSALAFPIAPASHSNPTFLRFCGKQGKTE